MQNENEIGRELKASELKPPQIVVLMKDSRPGLATTFWAKTVTADFIEFYAGDIRMTFIATRTGKDKESITDDSSIAMHMYEYLGEIS